jgi:hypothetical protein
MLSCRKSTPATPFTISDFPLAVGNQWVYQVNYNAFGQADTETLTISNKQSLSKDSVLYTIQYSVKHLSGTAIQYLLTIGDTLIYNPGYEGATPIGSMFVKLPCRPGDQWSSGAVHHDTTQLNSLISKFELPTGQIYKNVYYFRELSPFSPAYSDVETFVISPGIGIIEYNEDINDTSTGIFTNTTSSLISYQLQ